MNAAFFIRSLLFSLSFSVFVNYSHAQVTVVTGPSDHVTAPPASASAVSQVLSAGSNISIKIGTSSTATDIVYQWYKIDGTGTKQLVQSSSNGTFTETSTGAGYYIYQLLISNSNQCTSEISDPFKVYVLPALNPTIATSSSTICSNGSSTAALTATPGSTIYTYQYQWSLNGTNITGATSPTYTTATASTSGSNSYAVKVAYALSPTINGTATQIVNVIPVPTKPAISVGQ